LESIWPSEASSAVPTPVFVATTLLPALNAPYCTYSGSLTTGLFNEGLTWVVYNQPIRLSAAAAQSVAGQGRGETNNGQHAACERVGRWYWREFVSWLPQGDVAWWL
jgi:carbonic anhydrase